MALVCYVRSRIANSIIPMHFSVDLSLYGLCNEDDVPLGVYSKYGSLQGGPSALNSYCSSADILVVSVKPGGSVTRLAYIPSERSQDEIRYNN